MKKYVSVLALLLIALPGCAIKHPGALNAFDSGAYDTLIIAQAALNQAKSEVVAFPQYKDQLNQAIATYNTAISGYALYHNAVASAPTQAELQAQLNNLVAQIAALEKAFGVKL